MILLFFFVFYEKHLAFFTLFVFSWCQFTFNHQKTGADPDGSQLPEMRITPRTRFQGRSKTIGSKVIFDTIGCRSYFCCCCSSHVYFWLFKAGLKLIFLIVNQIKNKLNSNHYFGCFRRVCI